MKLCFASNNAHKLDEIRQVLPEYEVLSLNDLQFFEDIPETGTTLEQNSRIKAERIFNEFSIPCFADDTGLEIECLDGEPGVYSARYAGPKSSSEENVELVLQKMAGMKNRKAQFRTVITYYDLNGRIKQFEGIVKGEIIDEKRGDEGFGYDPIFIPEGHDRTFAELTMEEKNEISHRGRAVRSFVDYLQQ